MWPSRGAREAAETKQRDSSSPVARPTTSCPAAAQLPSWRPGAGGHRSRRGAWRWWSDCAEVQRCFEWVAGSRPASQGHPPHAPPLLCSERHSSAIAPIVPALNPAQDLPAAALLPPAPAGVTRGQRERPADAHSCSPDISPEQPGGQHLNPEHSLQRATHPRLRGGWTHGGALSDRGGGGGEHHTESEGVQRLPIHQVRPGRAHVAAQVAFVPLPCRAGACRWRHCGRTSLQHCDVQDVGSGSWRRAVSHLSRSGRAAAIIARQPPPPWASLESTCRLS